MGSQAVVYDTPLDATGSVMLFGWGSQGTAQYVHDWAEDRHAYLGPSHASLLSAVHEWTYRQATSPFFVSLVTSHIRQLSTCMQLT